MLDSDQQKIVALREGYHAVLAGPGSGKSTVLLHRSSNLEGRLLCVTFTSEAAKNLRDKIVKIDPSRNWNGAFCTLHSLALRFAHEHSDAFPFTLAGNPLAEDGVAARAAFDAIGDKINYRAFTSWVSLQKRNRLDPASSLRIAERTGKNIDYAIAYGRYQASLRKQGVLDFDDLIYYMVEILEKRPDIRDKWQFEWVMQDEAQDACELDWKLLQLITEKHANLLCVGDAGQALYGFRGGVSEHFRNMEMYFPGTVKHYLGNNYRSTDSIVEFARRAYPYSEVSKHFKAMKGIVGVSPVVAVYSNQFREAEEIAKKLSQFEKVSLEQTAILARTNLALRPFEEALLDQGINYHLLGDSGFWESPEVKNVVYWIRCATSPTDNAIIGAIRTPFQPVKYLKKKQIIEKIQKRIELGETAWKATESIPELHDFRNFVRRLWNYQHMSGQDAVVNIVREIKALEYYKDEADINPDRDPIANIRELKSAASRYPSIAEFLDFMRKLSYSKKTRKGVCLSTIHSSKGKEWSNVFLVSVVDGILPHAKSTNIEEEKCCFLVGVSRAMDTLEVSYYGLPSRFLEPWLTVKEMNENEDQHEEGSES